MASSAALTTTHLPCLRSLLKDWEQKQPPPKGFLTPVHNLEDLSKDALDLLDNRDTESKDMVVAFRTRPPLQNEAADKFKGNPDEGISESEAAAAEATEEFKVDFCPGISVPSAEPGVFVLHVPGMKV